MRWREDKEFAQGQPEITMGYLRVAFFVSLLLINSVLFVLFLEILKCTDKVVNLRELKVVSGCLNYVVAVCRW